MSLTTIEISQSGEPVDGLFQAFLRVGGQSEISVTVTDPGGAAFERSLNWYHEDLPRFPLAAPQRRERAEETIKAYGRALFHQVFGGPEAIRALTGHRQEGFENCRLLVSGGMAFQRLHWELMEESETREPLAVQMPVQRGIRDIWDDQGRVGSGPSLNVLVVAARPRGAGDLDYRSITRVLLAESWNTEQPFRVDVVRPGTWRALCRHLIDREGLYQVIHFDLHGTVGVTADLRRDPGVRMPIQPEGGSGGHSAFLIFESDEPGARELVPASAVARLLATKRIPIAVLNACRSAEAPIGEPSLAEWLAKFGVKAAIGMAYPVTPDTVSRAMTVIYQELARGTSPAEAVLRCRKELRADPIREVSPEHSLSLQDWSAPVVYQRPVPLDLKIRAMTAQERERHFSSRAEAGPEPVEVKGRDFDVFAVERLITGAGPRTLLVHGPAGVGKTWFTTELLRWWWLRTGLAEKGVVLPIDDGGLSTVAEIVDHLAGAVLTEDERAGFQSWKGNARREAVASRLRSTAHLLIIDSGGAALPEPRELRAFLRQAGGGKSLIVLTSRSEEPGLAVAKRYLLHPPVTSSWHPAGATDTAVVATAVDAAAPADAETVTREPAGTEKAAEPNRARLSRWPNHTVPLTAGIGIAGLVLAAAATQLNDDGGEWPRSGSSVAPAVTTEAAGPYPTTEPDWVDAGTVAGVTISSPTAGQTTEACLTVRGTATGLAPGQTVLLANRRVGMRDGMPYFYYQATLTGTTWEVREVSLGRGTDQDYDIHALVGEKKLIDAAAAATDGNFSSLRPISGLRVGAVVRVHQKGRC